jgi:Fe-S cluster assembly scaffold IscU
MAANNEIGVLQPWREIGKLCRERGVLFHTDGVQAVGKVPIDVIKDNIDLMSITAHKIYGPKGVGALYVRRKNPRVQVSPIIDGGGHERGMRSGTLNVPGIVGLGKACAIATEDMAQESCKLAGLRNRLKDKIMGRLDEVYVNGTMEHRLPGNLNISFAYVEGESLLMGINDIAVSSGSACTSATLEPSYVLKALGTGDALAHSSIRFGIGRFNTEAEVDYVADRVCETVERLRELSPLYEMAKEGSISRREVGSRIALRTGFKFRVSSFKTRTNCQKLKPELETLKLVWKPETRNFETRLENEQWHIAIKSSITIQILATSGSLDKASTDVGTGLVGAPECGDVMKLQIKVNPDTNVIEDAKFKTFGCGSAIASSSLATEWVKGKTVDEALSIKNMDIVKELALPPVKIHCSVLAEDAIRAAISDWKKKQESTKPAEVSAK